MPILSTLQMSSYAVALATAGITGTVKLLKMRREAIDRLRTDLARLWTNEGDTSSTDYRFVSLDLRLLDGDLIGSLASPRRERDLDVNVSVHWGYAILDVTELLGRSPMPVANIRVRLKGNRNRLKWVARTNKASEVLPSKTLLWPAIARNESLDVLSSHQFHRIRIMDED